MEFGVFDHLDRYDLPLSDYYEDRLKLIEGYDRAGFYGYHLAEHHSAPIGVAPSPSIFLTAIAQRTQRLRFGPMVYTLPFYHPLRMIEEICMLDQMSRGRLEIGVGKGISPIELSFYGINPADAQAIFTETLKIIKIGLTEKSLNFQGKFFHFEDVPMELTPVQNPHPPIWYGVHRPESAEVAARDGANIMLLDPPREAQVAIERYRTVWPEAQGKAPIPKIGLGRFIVVAETDDAALAIARRAYLKWHESFMHLPRFYGAKFYKSEKERPHPRPPDFDTMSKLGQGIAGSPATVLQYLQAHVAETRIDYLVGQFAFGDISLFEAMQSLNLFSAKIMPQLKNAAIHA